MATQRLTEDDFDDDATAEPHPKTEVYSSSFPKRPPGIVSFLVTPAAKEWGYLCSILGSYFTASIILLAGWGKLGDRIADFFNAPQWLARVLALCALVLFIVLHGIPKLIAWSKNKRFVVTKGVADNFFRTSPYENEENDRKLFQREDGIHDQLYSWLTKKSEPVMYLSGESGAGKSSLLNAELIPKLEQTTGSRCFVLDRARDCRESLRKELLAPGRIWEKPTARFREMSQLIRKAADRLAEADGRLVLIVDQFEELVISPTHTSNRHRFVTWLLQWVISESSALNDPLRNVTVLLVVRDDYRPFLDVFAGGLLPPREQNRNWMEVKPFLLDHAHQFLNRSGLKLHHALKEDIFRQIAEIEENPDFVRPVTINMVGIVLVRRAVEGMSRLIRRKEAGGFIRSYIIQSIRQSDVIGSARPILRMMISTKRTKVARSVSDISYETGYTSGIVNTTLERLQQRALVRCLDKQDGRWEISHDFLARLLEETLRTWRQSTMQAVRRSVLPIALISIAAMTVGVYRSPTPWYMHGDVNSLNSVGGESKLHHAVRIDDLRALDWLLRHGAKRNAQNETEGRTAIMFAAMEGKSASVRRLIESQADPNICSSDGESALHLAAWYGHSEATKILLEAGADPNKVKKPFFTPLHFAAIRDHDNVGILLMDSGAQLEVSANAESSPEAGTPLLCAARHKNYRMMQLLLQRGANPGYILEPTKETALHFAVETSEPKMAKLLLNFQPRVNVNAKDRLGQTPVFRAARNGNPSVIKELMDSGGSLLLPDTAGNLPIHEAISASNLVNIQFLAASNRESLRAKNHAGISPLQLAISMRNLGILRVLLENGADLKDKDSQGRTARQMAVDLGFNPGAELIQRTTIAPASGPSRPPPRFPDAP
jgi:ankyrin repeat protein